MNTLWNGILFKHDESSDNDEHISMSIQKTSKENDNDKSRVTNVLVDGPTNWVNNLGLDCLTPLAAYLHLNTV
jgi:hypothetical protein